MSLREALRAVGDVDYDRRGTHAQPVFDRLSRLAAEIQTLIPDRYSVPISRGVGALPIGLWVSILDPAVTISPTRGIYVVYLFNDTRRRVSLSLNQGATNVRETARREGLVPRALLRHQAAVMRDVLGSQARELDTEIKLGKRGMLPDYEAGSAVAKTWSLHDLPAADILCDDLLAFLDLYAQVVPAIERLHDSDAKIVVPPRDPVLVLNERERRFEPKDDSDYRAHISEHEQVRSRAHETLIQSLKDWAASRGFEANNNVHPRDLILHGEHCELLVEVKILPIDQPQRALRECIGQLFEYRAFFQSASVRLVAALSANPGGAYTSLLDGLGIAAIWTEGGKWQGTATARSLGLVD